MTQTKKQVTYYAAVGNPNGPGWAEVLTTTSPDPRTRSTHVPTGITYRTTREMDAAISAKNKALHAGR